MKILAVLVLPCLLLYNASAQTETKDYREALHLISVWLEAQKDYEQLPGISVAIGKGQELLWSGAFGHSNVEEDLDMETSTLFSICSISKLFTAVAIMKLYDEQKLRLDDRIEDILTWYDLEQQFPDSGPITIRSLLTHSSGLPRENAFPHWNGPDYSSPTGEEIRASLSDQQTLYPASTYFQYSNLGIALLGEVVEEISGLDYETYVEMNILEPLALGHTRPTMPRELHGNELAVGYGVLNRHGKRNRMNFFEADGLAAAAGFSSNVEDLLEFAQWQFRLLDTVVTEVLKPSTLRYMHKVHWTDDDWNTTWGLGFNISKASDDSRWVSHGGYCPGYKTRLQLHPKTKMAYAVMINSSGGNPAKYILGMHGLIQKVKPVEKESEAGKIDLIDYQGFYEMENEEEWYVTSWENQLAVLPLPSSDPGETLTIYKPIDHDKFRRVRDDGELGETMYFNRDSEGKISGLRVYNYLYTKKG
ncbi:MAG: beta-lactamase family protein [Saprospiraceae bacterium]|nr:beta-lactamase family protein [Saprospiraceae bacterium]